MAATTHRVATASTANASTYASGAFTPAAAELLIALCVASDTATAAPTMTGTAMDWQFVIRGTYRTSLDSVYIFVANHWADAVSQTVTLNTGADAATGAVIYVAGVSGMTKVGLAAIRQSAKTDNGAAAGTPATTFGGVALTGNPCLGVVGNSTNPATITPPASFTEGVADTGYATPTTGAEYAFRDSGHVSATITWGSTSASTFGVASIELDTTIPLELPPVHMPNSRP